MALDWRVDNHGDDYQGPVVLFLPGLTGHSQAEYIKSLMAVAQEVSQTMNDA